MLDLDQLQALIARRTLSRGSGAAPVSPSTVDAQIRVSAPWSSTALGVPDESGMLTFEPAELSRKLGYHNESRPGLVVRSYLRQRYPDHPKNARWILTQEQADDVLANAPRKG